jgi:myosin heavy subunit
MEVLAYKRGWKKAAICNDAESLDYSRKILSENLIKRKDYQIGHTKISLKSDSLEKKYLAVSVFLGKKVRKFQALLRIIQRKRFIIGRKGAIQFQFVRMRIQRKIYYKLMKDAIDAREREKQSREAERLKIIMIKNYAPLQAAS